MHMGRRMFGACSGRAAPRGLGGAVIDIWHKVILRVLVPIVNRKFCSAQYTRGAFCVRLAALVLFAQPVS